MAGPRDWRKPHPALIPIVLRVLAGCDREHPADRVLGQVLATDEWLEPHVRGEVAQTVFDCFRWQGWLAPDLTPPQRVARVRELAAAFEQEPGKLPGRELRARAVPEWIWGEVAEDYDWLRSLQAHPVLWIRARPSEAPALAEELGPDASVFGEGLDAIAYRGEEDLYRHPAFEAGRYEIQDLSSQAVGVMCGALPGERWWDVCAGEGGKTLHLAQRMQNRGQLWATDRAGWRLRRLKRRAARAKVSNYQALPWSGTGAPPVPWPCDGVLVDAPCTGVGTWQRNPHARWTTRLEDVRELAEAQWCLLLQAAAKVKPGGRLIYSVCTLTRSETEAVADRADRELQGFEPLPLRNPLVEGPATARNWLRPWAQGGNGMFVAAWRRR